jgi:hypothetical protein
MIRSTPGAVMFTEINRKSPNFWILLSFRAALVGVPLYAFGKIIDNQNVVIAGAIVSAPFFLLALVLAVAVIPTLLWLRISRRRRKSDDKGRNADTAVGPIANTHSVLDISAEDSLRSNILEYYSKLQELVEEVRAKLDPQPGLVNHPVHRIKFDTILEARVSIMKQNLAEDCGKSIDCGLRGDINGCTELLSRSSTELTKSIDALIDALGPVTLQKPAQKSDSLKLLKDTAAIAASIAVTAYTVSRKLKN